MLMKSANPVLTRGFQEISYEEMSLGRAHANTMTVQGTIIKSGILLAMTVVTGGVGWSIMASNPGLGMALWGGGALLGCLAALIVCFWQDGAAFLAPIYALAKGLAIGGFTQYLAHHLELTGKASSAGLFAAQAMVLTFAIFGGLLTAYSFRIVRLGTTATKVVWTMICGVALFTVLMIVLNIFGVAQKLSFDLFSPTSGSLMGIGFSLFLVVLASLRLVTDFQYIEEGVASGQPKTREWLGAFGLLVSLVWLYVEVLRLLSKLRSR